MRLSRASRAILPSAIFAAMLASSAPSAMAQAPTAALAEPLHFDVTSVRENKTGEGGMRWQTTDTSYIATNVTLITVIMNGYGLRADQVSGAPGWVDSTHFDIQGKLVDSSVKSIRDLSRKQHQELMQSILFDRFKLKAHMESREAPTYDLLLAKGGAKIKAVEPVDPKQPAALTGKGIPRGGFMFGNGMIQASAQPVSQLADLLASSLERTVIDKTGLPGVYDYKLNWSPDTAAPTTENAPPTLFTALQEQLGLRLQPSRGPVQTLVIDHIELPSSNDE